MEECGKCDRTAGAEPRGGGAVLKTCPCLYVSLVRRQRIVDGQLMAARDRRCAALPARRPRALFEARGEHVLVERASAGLGRVPGDQPGHGRVDDERHQEQERDERQGGRGAQAQADLGL